MCITPPLMEFLCLILLCVEHRLGVFGLWYLTVARPDIACSVHIALSLQQFFRSWDISVVPSSRAFCFHPLRHWCLELTLIQIGLLMLLMQIDYRILYFSWRFFYSWKSRKPLYCRFHSWGRVVLRLLRRSFGYEGFSVMLRFIWPILLLCVVISRAISTLGTILFFMNVLSTLRWTAILCIINLLGSLIIISFLLRFLIM